MTSLTLKSPIWKTETICFSLVSENIYLKSEPDLCMLEGGFGDDGYKEIDCMGIHDKNSFPVIFVIVTVLIFQPF